MEKNPINLRKIPLGAFIDALLEMYEMGADFIDLLGIPDEKQDIMSIVVRKEYIDQNRNSFGESDEFFVNDFDSTTYDKDLSDDDIDNIADIS